MRRKRLCLPDKKDVTNGEMTMCIGRQALVCIVSYIHRYLLHWKYSSFILLCFYDACFLYCCLLFLSDIVRSGRVSRLESWRTAARPSGLYRVLQVHISHWKEVSIAQPSLQILPHMFSVHIYISSFCSPIQVVWFRSQFNDSMSAVGVNYHEFITWCEL
jgi:hypothetical protein